VLDDCDPATFNAMFGPGTCVKDGTTTFQAFIAQLLAQGRAPAWRFAPPGASPPPRAFAATLVPAGGTVTTAPLPRESTVMSASSIPGCRRP
jgi:hypothetical protein